MRHHLSDITSRKLWCNFKLNALLKEKIQQFINKFIIRHDVQFRKFVLNYNVLKLQKEQNVTYILPTTFCLKAGVRQSSAMVKNLLKVLNLKTLSILSIYSERLDDKIKCHLKLTYT